MTCSATAAYTVIRRCGTRRYMGLTFVSPTEKPNILKYECRISNRRICTQTGNAPHRLKGRSEAAGANAPDSTSGEPNFQSIPMRCGSVNADR